MVKFNEGKRILIKCGCDYDKTCIIESNPSRKYLTKVIFSVKNFWDIEI